MKNARLTLHDGTRVPDLLTVDGNPKVGKGAAALGYWPAVLHLAPAGLSGRNVCPWATDGCRAGCLNKAGRGGIIRRGETTNAIQRACVTRTRAWWEDRAGFLDRLAGEISRHVERAKAAGLLPAVRLNGTSDLPWEDLAPDLFARFADVQFWDYTKGRARAQRATDWRTVRDALDDDPADNDGRIGRALIRTNGDARPWPRNYDLTFSWSGLNGADAVALMLDGGRVSVPFRNPPPPGDFVSWTGGATWVKSNAPEEPTLPRWEIVDGDSSDLRFLDPGGVVVGLRAKGPARRDRSGFVVDL